MTTHPLAEIALSNAIQTLTELELRRMTLNEDPDASPLDKHYANIAVESQQFTVDLVARYLTNRSEQ